MSQEYSDPTREEEPFALPLRPRAVVIRGSKCDIAEAMDSAGIPFVFRNEAGYNTVGYVQSTFLPQLSVFLDQHPQFEGRFANVD